ncbi:MAG: hypothetical protein BGO55_06115 [Sphingobacteriales bacterium 50-39]|nr:hypothetical protein [Sphingobacteriales bacterium]OJW56154.1 MAG: hypothetical protein BGO55_06115 [Sphingobacteriales bacterium 50-39]
MEIIILYAGFLFCFSAANPFRRWTFLGLRLALIFLLNIIRGALLVWIFLRHRQYLDFSHAKMGRRFVVLDRKVPTEEDRGIPGNKYKLLFAPNGDSLYIWISPS